MRENLESLFEKNTEPLAASLSQALKSALEQYGNMSRADGKSDIPVHIYISFLLSGVVNRLPLLRIDLFDEKDRADTASCFVYWDAPAISEDFYKRAGIISKQNEQTKDYELDRICLELADEYFEVFEIFMPRIAGLCKDVLPQDCTLHFGQFSGNTSVVERKNGVF